MQHIINWFEIPTAQLGRATEFYRAVTGYDLQVESSGGPEMTVFKGEKAMLRGALVRDERHQPGAGTLVYLNVTAFPGGLDGALERVPGAGGSIVLPRTAIGPNGWIALFKDTEGNTIGLHQALEG